MWIKFQLKVFLVVYQMHVFNLSCPDYWLRYTRVFENVAPESAVTTVSSDSPLRCGVACKLEPHCVAFAFHQQRSECHLYNRNVEELKSSPDPGLQVFRMVIEDNDLGILNSTSASSVDALHPINAIYDNNATSCFQTNKEDYEPWFLVDLTNLFLIRFIVVHNEDEYPERLHDVNYEVYDSDPTINNSSEGNCCASVADYNTGKNIIRCKDGVRGRFVKISIEKSNFLTLCGLEIYGIQLNEKSDTCNQKYECRKLPVGKNIALGKPTTQSTTYEQYFDSSQAVDGERSGNGQYVGLRSCQHTGADDINPWWQVDLQYMYDITSVTISNRYDFKQVLGERLSDVSVMVYDSDPSVGNPSSTLCKFLPGVFGCTVRTFECDEKTVGRFIRITKPTEFLNVCEVEVTGIKQ